MLAWTPGGRAQPSACAPQPPSCPPAPPAATTAWQSVLSMLAHVCRSFLLLAARGARPRFRFRHRTRGQTGCRCCRPGCRKGGWTKTQDAVGTENTRLQQGNVLAPGTRGVQEGYRKGTVDANIGRSTTHTRPHFTVQVLSYFYFTVLGGEDVTC